MARSVTSTGNEEFVLKLLNTDEQQKLFFELTDAVQMNVLNAAFRKAGKVILDAAKSNFDSTKKMKSTTNYADLAKSFKMATIKGDVGMRIGMQAKEGFKYRFLNFGTKARFTKGKTKRFTGVINPSMFFTNAVENNAEQAQSMLSDEIILSLERCVRRYEKKAGN